MQISLQTDFWCVKKGWLLHLLLELYFCGCKRKLFQCLILLTFFTFFYCIGFENGQGLGKNLHEIQHRKWDLNSSVVLHIWRKVIIHRVSRKYEKIVILHFFSKLENYFVIWWFCNFVQNAMLLTHYKTLNYFSPLSKFSILCPYQKVSEIVLCQKLQIQLAKKNREIDRATVSKPFREFSRLSDQFEDFLRFWFGIKVKLHQVRNLWLFWEGSEPEY